jgi:HK97 family phage prohead protease
MSDTEVDFARLFSNGTSTSEKSGPDVRICQALVKSIDTPKRRITAIASAPVIDRHDEIIEAKAFTESLRPYLKDNPVVLVAHRGGLSDGHSPVVGNVVSGRIGKGGLAVEIEFHNETDLAREYWQLYSKKIQRALSVGFIPQEGGPEQREGQRVYVHRRVELLEISCVPVPSCRPALSRSAQKKLAFIEAKKQEREDEKIAAEIREEMAAQGRDWDAECEEFAEMLLGARSLPWEADEAEKDTSDETEFASYFT